MVQNVSYNVALLGFWGVLEIVWHLICYVNFMKRCKDAILNRLKESLFFVFTHGKLFNEKYNQRKKHKNVNRIVFPFYKEKGLISRCLEYARKDINQHGNEICWKNSHNSGVVTIKLHRFFVGGDVAWTLKLQCIAWFLSKTWPCGNTI